MGKKGYFQRTKIEELNTIGQLKLILASVLNKLLPDGTYDIVVSEDDFPGGDIGFAVDDGKITIALSQRREPDSERKTEPRLIVPPSPDSE